MQSKFILGEIEVNTMLSAARAEALANGWNVAIAIVDDGGHQLAFLRTDNTAPVASHIALEKAKSAALGQRETKGYEDMINNGRSAFLSAPLHGLLEGGVPVIIDGKTIGAVGVSGVQKHEDAQIAKAAIAAIA